MTNANKSFFSKIFDYITRKDAARSKEAGSFGWQSFLELQKHG